MDNIIKILQDKGFDTIPESFYSQIETWKSWYDGNVKDFHSFTIFNGQRSVQCRRYALGMAKKVAEDWANLLLNEKVSITLEGEQEQAFFDEVCRNNNFDVKSNEMQELKSALGTAAYVVRASGISADAKTGEISGDAEIKIDYVTAPNIYPLSWDNGIVNECAFSSSFTRGGNKYVYLQIHRLQNGKYVIENGVYRNTNGNLSEVAFSEVPGFENVAAVVNTQSDNPLFVIDRLNIANNIDNTLPMGIPAFANAIDQLKGVDIAYDSYVNEFVLGKKRIMVKPGAAKREDGMSVFDPNELCYYVLPEDISNDSVITPIDMSLRTAEHNAGLQDALNVLSSRCGFGENHYRFDSGNISTATQVISENSAMFRTIKKHEIILESVLMELCRIILRIGKTVVGLPLNEDVEISIDFDDSIIEDKQQEFNRTLQLLSAGLMKPEEARAILMNEDIETARAALPGMEDLTDEEQDEVE